LFTGEAELAHHRGAGIHQHPVRQLQHEDAVGRLVKQFAQQAILPFGLAPLVEQTGRLLQPAPERKASRARANLRVPLPCPKGTRTA
jgi:hypothetical protein